MDVIREETGLPSPVSSPKANSKSHGDEVHLTKVAAEDYPEYEPSGSAHKKAAPSRF